MKPSPRTTFFGILALSGLLLILLSCRPPLDNGELYVAPNGNDSNPGTIDKPIRTLEKAARLATAGTVCYIREGTYYEVLKPSHSGEEDQAITFRSYPGERVVISALEPLTGWVHDSEQVFRTEVKWDLGQENLVLAEGVVCDLARWPNHTSSDPFDLNILRNTGGSEKSVEKDAFLEYTPGIPQFDWQEGGSVYFFGDAPGCGWLAWRSYIKATEGNKLYFDLPGSWIGANHAPADSGEFYLQGIKEVLDYPYEWYLSKDKILYLQLPEGRKPADGDVLIRKRKVCIDLDGRDHIVIQDLAVIGGSIEVTEFASHNHISGITSFYGNHTAGIVNDYQTYSQSVHIKGDYNILERSELAYGAGTGVRVEGDGNLVLDNLIHDFNTLGCYDAPVIMRNGSNTVLKNNTIYNAGRDGIQMFHRDSEIAFNDVYNTNLIAHDCGPIYTLGGPFNSEIHHNWFHDVGGRGHLYKGTGIYLDNSSVGFSVHHNVVWNTRWSSIQINLDAKDIIIYNNTFWNGSEAMGWWRPKVGEFPGLKADTKFENVKVLNNLSNDDTWDPQTIQENNLSTQEDPFVNSAGGDFRLKEDLGSDLGAYKFGEDWKAGIEWDSKKGPADHGNYGLLTERTPAPDWFRDGKFGIYFHWGIYSVPAFGTEWYPRHMYLENHKGWGAEVRPFHLETYGRDKHYHQFIPDFTAAKFDAQEWAKLFKASGAKYAGPVAEHCDNFSMWDSKINKWNAVNMGPERDVVGELEKAIKGEGLKFVTTFHHQWNWSWYPTWSGLVDTSTTDLQEFYGEWTSPETFGKYGSNPEEYGPSEEFIEYWKAKVNEVVDGYKPDMLWFDSRLNSIPMAHRMEVINHFYDMAAKNKKSVVVNFKNKDLPSGSGVLDIERGRLDEKVDYPWLTDDSWDWSGWNYKENHDYKSANHILDGLIDIVSKNGSLLLNIGPRADGTIPEEVRLGLLELGSWLEQYGEAIYGTRPFLTYGEGPTKLVKGPHGGVTDRGISYTDEDFRYTTHGNTLYIIQLGDPEVSKEYILKTFSNEGLAAHLKIESLELVGSIETLSWSQMEDGLHLTAPGNVPDKKAVVYKALIN